MELKFTYSFELLERCLWHQTKKMRRTCAIWFLGNFIFALALIVADLISKSARTAYAGMFFLAIALIWAFSLKQNRKAAIRSAVEKQLQSDPNKTAAYRFEDNALYVTLNSDMTRTETRLLYDFIQTVEQIDNTRGYMITKSGLSYLLQCDSGISGVIAFLREKSGGVRGQETTK
ncbi:MAG: hypothetical protein E7620_03260 [Ruminococcaceae bacterium]|nr:hypothetical protein [Oscillospiraceae bacterium]